MTLKKRSTFPTCLIWAGLLAGGLAQAQSVPADAASDTPGPTPPGWQACQILKADATAQLACFQRWADSQSRVNTPAPSLTTAPANPATGHRPADHAGAAAAHPE